jgi:flagellar basal-body rod protein FlgF
MNFGLYTAYLGMRARQQRLDLIANNIANASTSGFKEDRLLYRSVEAAEIEANQTATNSTPINGTATSSTPAAPAGANTATASEAGTLTPVKYGRDVGVLTSRAIDFSPGSVRETGRSLDVAIEGEGFLVVQTPRGERYTRQGSLTLDASGQLVTPAGDLVIGTGGPITVPPGQVTIADDGSISVDGRVAGQLKLVRFADANASLAKEGNSLFVATGVGQPSEATSTRVVQGALEMSNVNSLTEMVAMMQNTREFESLQRSVTTLMNDLGRTIANDLGRI